MFSRKCFNRLAMTLILMILLSPCGQLAFGQDSAGIWKDGATGLLWTVADNGSDTNWAQANNYCEDLALGGQTDWRLPTRDELETIYDKNLSKKIKAKEQIQLNGETVWADSNSSGNAWLFSFLNGGTSLLPAAGSCGSTGRALCVRRPEK